VWEGIQRGLDKPSLPADVAVAVKADPAQRTPEQTQAIRDYFLENVHSGSRIIFDPLHTQSETLAKQIQDLDKTMPSTMVAQELPKPRDAFFLNRGEYDKKGDKVERDVPAVFPPLPEGAPRNRLGLAQWLVDPSHPLTARVTVNRYWQQYFGVGLVKTAEDFGSQGQWPSHPALLDWLACEFVASGWDVKHIQRLIVTSGTYRQDARFGPDRLPEDRENILLARGPRYRMDAEMVRDNALAISGLLVEKIGGRSVRPYQPSGIWKAVAYTSSNTANFKKDSGESLYRRSMYTFWKRTAPPPTMLLLDAPSRETCTVRRARTNTPLAALALLNDVQFFEAARKLGERAAREGGATLDEQIAFAFRLATARRPDAEELDVLRGQYEAHLAEFHNDAEAAGKVLGVGDSPRDDAIDTAQAAAWTMVANVILNLDETVTKQ